MTAPTLPATITANVRRLLKLPDDEPGVAKVMKLGFANGTAQRILDSETALGSDTLERLADGLGVHAWQLLVPDLDPEKLPKLEPLPFRWPFRQIDPEVVTGLVGTSAQNVENGLLATLATAGISPRKPRSKAA